MKLTTAGLLLAVFLILFGKSIEGLVVVVVIVMGNVVYLLFRGGK